jgi:GNAT superfamily N-acetyltransferase
LLQIRPATPADIPEMLAFIRELAEYEREPASALATADDLLRDGFPEPGSKTPARFHALIAEWREDDTAVPQPAGLALYFYNYSTWRGHAGIWIEDLFVRPQFRGRGIGKALLTRVAAIAVAEGCPRLEWSCWTGTRPPSTSTVRSAPNRCLSGPSCASQAVLSPSWVRNDY